MSEETRLLDQEIVVSMSNATYKGEVGPQGPQGEPGLSAYLVAVDNGFIGSQQDWLNSLKGEKGETGTKGETGASAYQIAVANGFEGTEAQWLLSLKGEPGEGEGSAGLSAYEIAVVNGFEGTEEEWLASLKGETGETGPQGPKGETGATGQAGATPVKGVDYFTQQDIDDIIENIDLSDYALASDIADFVTHTDLEEVVQGIESGALKRSVVQTLPVSNIDGNTIYMVPNNGSTGNVYDEYLYVNNTWEKIGDTAVDLSDYVTQTDLEDYATSQDLAEEIDSLLNNEIATLNSQVADIDTELGNLSFPVTSVNGETGDVELDIPEEYVLPAATTATLGGVMVDGSTITADANGVISAASSGSSYTAGDGINIDANDVISNNATLFNSISGSFLTSGSLSSGNNIFSYDSSYITATTSIDVLVSNLKKYGVGEIDGVTSITPAILNQNMGTNFAVMKLSFDILTDTVSSTNYSATSTGNNLGELRKYFYIIMTKERYIMAELSTIRYLIANHIGLNITVPTGTNYTGFRLKKVISQLDAAISTKLTAPTAPSSDGLYKLTSTISSGTASYAWSADTAFSGSYNDLTDKPTIPAAYTLPTATTATLGGVMVDGSTITITDGVISASGGGSGSSSSGSGVRVINMTSNNPPGLICLSGISAEDKAYMLEAYNHKLDGYFFIIRNGLNRYFYPIWTHASKFYFYSPLGPLSTSINGFNGKSNSDICYIAADGNPGSATAFSGQNLNGSIYAYAEPASYNWENLRASSGQNNMPFGSDLDINATLNDAFYFINSNFVRKTKVPNAPTTDGTYNLQCVVSSGTATYSWVAVT